MSQQTIGIGSVANDGTGDALRTAFTKTNANFTELYNGAGGIVSKSGVAVALTGSTSETAMATIALAANALGVDGVLRVTSIWTMPSSANAKTLRHRLGGLAGTVIQTISVTTVANMRVETLTIAAHATNSQNSQSVYPRGTDLLMTDSGNTATAVDMTQAQSLVISGQLASGAETLTLLGYIVEVLQ